MWGSLTGTAWGGSVDLAQNKKNVVFSNYPVSGNSTWGCRSSFLQPQSVVPHGATLPDPVEVKE